MDDQCVQGQQNCTTSNNLLPSTENYFTNY